MKLADTVSRRSLNWKTNKNIYIYILTSSSQKVIIYLVQPCGWCSYPGCWLKPKSTFLWQDTLWNLDGFLDKNLLIKSKCPFHISRYQYYNTVSHSMFHVQLIFFVYFPRWQMTINHLGPWYPVLLGPLWLAGWKASFAPSMRRTAAWSRRSGWRMCWASLRPNPGLKEWSPPWKIYTLTWQMEKNTVHTDAQM